MSEERGIYNRLGKSGGLGCPVSILDISYKQLVQSVQGELICASKSASELELLRTVATKLNAQWGKDDLGWWAVIEKKVSNNWNVYRQDDNANEFLIASDLTETEANQMAYKFEAKGHKQIYWVSESK